MKARGPETMSAMSSARCAARPSPTLEPSALRTSARLGAERHHSGVDGHPTCVHTHTYDCERVPFQAPGFFLNSQIEERKKKKKNSVARLHCEETVGQCDSRVINKRGQPAGRAEICSTERDFSHVLPFSANGGTTASEQAL